MVYTYDKTGNILSKKKYAYTNPTSSVSGSYTNYSYGYASTWKDRLTSYNGKSLTYDEIGNPLTYGTYRYQWAYGRQLSQIENGSDIVATFNYNDEGIRTVKTAQNSAGQDIRHEYDVVGGQINREVVRSSSSATSAVMKDIRYYYDAAGKPVAIRAFTRTSSTANFTDTIYYLQTNLQGDVVGIYNASGTKIYEYAYDAWGNIIKSSQVATGGTTANEVNPFRYRGYYFDTETSLYYLQSRYYNPEWGRFLNADFAEVVSNENTLTDKNLYAYCDNNPVMRVDEDGEFWNIVIGAAVGGIVGGVFAGISSYANTGKVDWGSVVINAVVGAAGGAIAATGLSAIAQAGLTAVVSGAGNAADQIHKNKGLDNFNPYDVAFSAGVGGASSLLGTGLGKVFGRKIEQAGMSLLNKGQDKLLTGYVRQSVGQSHSALLRQGTKLVAQASVKINTFRGLSSVIGSGAGVVPTIGADHVRKRLGW